MSLPTTPTTPKTPTSRKDHIAFVYGEPLKTLEPGILKVTDCHLIRIWMHFYDDFRSSWKTNNHEVIKNVARYLMTFWKSQPLATEILSEKQVITKVAGVINRVQKMIKKNTYSPNKSNQNWIDNERKLILNRIFDIGIKTPETQKDTLNMLEPSGSGTQQKAADMVCKKKSFHRLLNCGMSYFIF